MSDGVMTKRRAIGILSAVVILSLLVAAVLVVIFRDTVFDKEKFRALVDEHYLLGVLILIFVTALQVVLAVIPGEALELAAGYAFGMWPGAIYATVGIVIGSSVAIMLTRKFGRELVDAIYPIERIERNPLFCDRKRRDAMTLLLFFIPGTPKDMLTYILGLSDMSILRYLLLTTVARFPSVIMSTAGTDLFAAGKYATAAIVLAASAATGLIGSLIYRYVMQKRK